MENFKIIQIKNPSEVDLQPLVEESTIEGFRFLKRLMDEFENGTNRFNQPGEILYGVLNSERVLIAVGGLNIDPYSDQEGIGRLRRFYVSGNERRNGVGTFLLSKIIAYAENHFNILVLHTDTKRADEFYTSFGFTRGQIFPNTTHYKRLEKEFGNKQRS